MPEQIRGQKPGTILAFDFGLQRIGVAVGEPELGTAHALPVIRAQAQAGKLTAIEALVQEWKPALLLVGRPLGEDGAAHEMTRRAERFARQLAARFKLPIELADERYSSVEVESRMRATYGARKTASLARGKALDSHAAQIILEQYFDGKATRR
jgi:putative Holliday junction resolvase